MSAFTEKLQEFTIFEGITCNPAWHGMIPGLIAEKMLKNYKTPYLYILRKGESSPAENQEYYYVSFILPDLSIRHQPVVVFTVPEGWCYHNAKPGGPYQHTTIDPVLHLIMHCEEGECIPLVKQ